jgi:hypothetical protein
MADSQPISDPGLFADVLLEELELIRSRRKEILGEELASRNEGGRLDGAAPSLAIPAGDADSRLRAARLKALDEHLMGITFSGGGIRSGTFAVGLLQGLSSLGLLRRFDYLSTVSGGGYAGGWLASWLKRDGNVRNVERQLAPSRVSQAEAWRDLLHPKPDANTPSHGPHKGPVVDEEPEPIHHLRSYSSYMAPELGLLTADTWTIIVIWVRNVAVNMMMFFPMMMALVLVARLLLNLYGTLTTESIGRSLTTQTLSLIPLGLGGLMLFIAFNFNGKALREFRRGGTPRPFQDEGTLVYWRWLYPLMLAALFFTLSLRPVIWWIGDRFKGTVDVGTNVLAPGGLFSFGGIKQWLLEQFGRDLGLLGVPNVVGHLLFFGLVFVIGAFFRNLFNGTLTYPYSWKFLRAAFFAGATGGVLLTVVEFSMTALSDANHPDLVAMLATPAMLLVVASAMIVEVALVGRSINEAEREWWSRLGALVTIGGILWILAFAIINYVPALMLGVGLPIRLVITSGWVATIIAGVLAGRYARPVSKGGSSVLATIATVAPPLFMVGILGAISLLVSGLVNDPSVAFPLPGGEQVAIAHYFKGLRGAGLPSIILWLGSSLVLVWIGSTLIDVNLFSLNAMYANRLIRCYLGASRPKKTWAKRWGGSHDPAILSGAPIEARYPARDQNPATGFDPTDDIDLIDIRIGYVNPSKAGDRPYWGPHVLLNASLNLVGGEELAWRDRKAESFTLSPLYCGSKGTGYARVDQSTRTRLTLGRAMSISGAAVDPNMRMYQSASLTAFLTLMNARLGYWMENPGRPSAKTGWSADSPKYSHLLWSEFFGKTVSTGMFVHLADGCNFDNMGVYELIRRRCRYIVACDAGDDIGPSDDNLAILLRLVRIDFGVRIELDSKPFLVHGSDKLSRAHVIVGTVHYEDVDGGEVPGIIVYVRISMTGDEPPDLQQYAQSSNSFPHQPTSLTQSFSEEQFESYRALGDHIARKVFGKSPVEPPTDAQGSFWTRTNPHQEFVEGNRRLFEELMKRWGPSKEAQDPRKQPDAKEHV